MAIEQMERQTALPSPTEVRDSISPRSQNGQGDRWPTLDEVTTQQLSQGLGWFSIGLGLAEILAPTAVARVTGLGGGFRLILPVLGLREIASGIGILTQKNPTPWVWSRVAGDMMDLAVLGMALRQHPLRAPQILGAGAAVAGVTALDIFCAERLSGHPQAPLSSDGRRGIAVRQAITIQKPREELYRLWRNFENLPKWMRHLESVEPDGENRWRWVAKGPVGKNVSWTAELVEDEPNYSIAWRSLPGSEVDTRGAVWFEDAPGNRGTEINIAMIYDPPGGQFGAAVAFLTGRSAEQEMREDLRRFKQLLECGEIATTAGQPRGKCSAMSRGR